MPGSCNTESVGRLQIEPKQRHGELGKGRRGDHRSSSAAAAATTTTTLTTATTVAPADDYRPLVLDVRDSILLTLSPRAGNKLALKYENPNHIKLSPAAQSRLSELQRDRPLRAILENYCAARDQVENLRLNMSFLADEKRMLSCKKGRLQQQLKQEQAKNDDLRACNETLRFDLSALATRTLELSIDKQILEDEMEKILWEGNYKFLLPLKNGAFYRKL